MANYLCTLQGTLVPGQQHERFTQTFGIISSSSVDTIGTAIVEQWTAIWSLLQPTLAHTFPAGVTYEEATVAEIMEMRGGEANPGVTPKVKAAQHFPFTPVLTGTNLTNILPTQLAIVVSWRAGVRPNGTPLRGRMYLPTPAQDAVDGTNGHLKAAYQSEIVNMMQQWAFLMQQAGHWVAVWSRKEGRLAQLTDVRVGNQIDTIRSRRNEVDETYIELPIIPPG